MNRTDIRIGSGYDVHRLVEGRRLILGGVEIEYSLGLLGHSDADVLLHSVSDALLSAARLGDIGDYFPDSDSSFKDADSMKLLKRAYEEVVKAGFVLLDLDCTIAAQAPKIAPYKKAMRENIANALDISVDNVGLKATTTEGLGFEGRGEGISAMTVCLLGRP